MVTDAGFFRVVVTWFTSSGSKAIGTFLVVAMPGSGHRTIYQ